MERFEPLGVGVGTTIGGRYDIERLLGSGGMSAVYLVRDRALNNQLCALKLLEPKFIGQENELERFRNEVLISRKLTHPNIVRTYEFGQTVGGHYFITMEFIAGTTLQRIIHGSSSFVPLPDVIKYLLEISKGIAYAHGANVVHRDLKPANILISENGEIKVTDFGLAKTLEIKQQEQQLTQAGECVGTPSYMAPEQVTGDSVDHRVDIYGLGMIGYELVMGSVPFAEQNWYNLASQIVNEPLPHVSSVKNGIPRWFDDFLQKATAKRPENRYSSAEEVVQILEAHIDERAAQRQRKALKKVNKKNAKLGAMLYQLSPVITIVAIVFAGLLLLIGFSQSGGSPEIQTQFQEGTNRIKNLVNVLQKLNEVVITTDKNHEKITDTLEDLQKKKDASRQPKEKQESKPQK